MAGHLIALANACREWRDRPFAAQRRLDGVADALDITARESARLRDGGQTQTVTLRQLDDALAVVALAVRQAPLSDDDLAARLVGLAAEAEIMTDIAGALAIERGDGSGADMLFWAQASLNSIDAHRHDLAQSADAARSLTARLSILESTARSMALAMDFGFLFDRDRQLLSIGYLAPEGALDSNCYDLLASEARLASFFAIAKGDVAARALVPARPRRDARRAWRRADFVVGIDVRIPDALAGHARAGRKPARADQPSDRAPPDRLRREAGPAVGHIRIRLQRPRPGVHLPIFEFRRSRPRAEARSGRKSGDRALRDRSGGDGRSARGRRPISRGSAEVGARGRYGFYDALDYTPARVPEGEASPSCEPSWRTIRA